ncbi:MAG: universal stress protein [SAR202 cluster bacterium]|nr:universal stress protein [SAR202 cluster bacterium]
MPIKSILVPLDGSPQAEAVIPYVYAIAASLSARVMLLHVIGGSRAVAGKLKSEAEQQQYLERIQSRSYQAAQHYLLQQVGKMKDAGIQADSAVAMGDPSSVIVEYGGDVRPDLIAVSAHGRSGDGVLMGSVASHLVQNSRSPLLLVPKLDPAKTALGFVEEIIVALDTSEMAETVLPLVHEVAMGLKARATLVLSIPKLSQLYLGPEMVSHPQDILDKSEREASAYFTEIAMRMHSEGVATGWKVLHGEPANAIVEHARNRPNSMIAIATHGRSGIGRWVMGSVTEKVVHASAVPVLVYRPAK